MSVGTSVCLALALPALIVLTDVSRSVASLVGFTLLAAPWLIAFEMIAVGAWMYASPHPSTWISVQSRRSRATIRACSAIQLAGSLAFVLELLSWSTGIGNFDIRIVLVSLPAMALAWFVQVSAVLVCSARLAHMIPDEHLRRKSMTGVWLAPTVSIVAAPVFMIGPLFAAGFQIDILSRIRDHLRSIERTGRPAQNETPAPANNDA